MKSCFEQLKENCINCNNSKMVDGDYCHALRAYQQGKADERAKTIDEFYNRLLTHKTDINLANYPWNYVGLVARKMKNELKE